MSDTSKFANVPDDELKAYVADSEQRAGETDSEWAEQVRRAERDLVDKYRDAVKPEAVKDDPLSSITPYQAPDVTEGQPQ